ncbi:basic secretory protein-like protein [Paludisphaera sp.]|uniref:basic secretory protein-like protein n=1 Tax=Paludisphaera sp. TaxID=2017432 RepID=UPI00301E2F2B
MLRLALMLPLIVAAPGPDAGRPVAVVVESTLPTSGGEIRQQAFDGDPDSAYESARPPREGDAVTLAFDAPVLVRSVEVRASGLDGGTLEGAEDGATFAPLAEFREGVAKAEPGKTLKAVRVVPAKDATEPIAIREFLVESDPGLRRFEFPVEFVVDEVDDPALKDWADRAARECERAYDLIAHALRSDGYRPAKVVRMSLKDGIDVPAYASGDRVTGSTKWFRDHPDDVGAMVHEAAHVVQRYRSRRNPGWLVEGVADYVRFVLYEPENIGGINADRARYDQSYRVTARFLGYIVEKHDPDFVLKLNRAMREGKYSDDIFKESTGKTMEELGAEWKESLKG